MDLRSQLEKVGSQWKVRRDTELQQIAVSFLHNAWKNQGDPRYFPGPQPVSIERKHFTCFQKPYFVCEKSDGVRHVLMAFMYQGNKMCVLVNRALEVTLYPLSLPKISYEGTILDGELVEKLFLVYDAVLVSGINVANENLVSRLTQAGKVVSAILRTVKDAFTVRMKTFFKLKDIEEFYEKYLPTLTYKTDGLVFTPVDEPVRSGTHETLFKWKPCEKNTVDFLVKRNGTKWCLYVQERGTLYFQGDVRAAPEWITDGCIAECQLVPGESLWWKPIGLRTDKVHPNNRRTLYNTLTNIRENIQWREFIQGSE